MGEIFGVIEQKTNQLITKYLSLPKEQENKDENIPKSDTKKTDNKQLGDKQAEAASLGIGIGAASLQPMVAVPASIFDDFSDEDDEYNNDDEIFSQQQQPAHGDSKK